MISEPISEEDRLITVFNGTDRVMTRDGMISAATLRPGMDILTRRGFKELVSVRLATRRIRPVTLPAMHTTSQLPYHGDARRVLFITGQTLRHEIGLHCAFLLYADIIDWMTESDSLDTGFSGVVLEFERQEVVVTDYGPFATHAKGDLAPVLNPVQARHIFMRLIDETEH